MALSCQDPRHGQAFGNVRVGKQQIAPWFAVTFSYKFVCVIDPRARRAGFFKHQRVVQIALGLYLDDELEIDAFDDEVRLISPPSVIFDVELSSRRAQPFEHSGHAVAVDDRGEAAFRVAIEFLELVGAFS